jgi:hypothetical protein
MPEEVFASNLAEMTEFNSVQVKRAKKEKPPAAKLFPVKLLRNYRVVGDFTVGGEVPAIEQREKVFAGAFIEVEPEEAREMIAKGIALRNDPIG